MDASGDKKLHILIVDDEETITRLAGRILRSEGYEVVVANTVEEARVKIETMLQNGGLDVILTDWDIPVRNAGAQVLAEGVKAGVSALVAMSGRLDHDEETGGAREGSVKAGMREAGAKEFLPKPFRVNEMIDAIRNALFLAMKDAENK